MGPSNSAIHTLTSVPSGAGIPLKVTLPTKTWGIIDASATLGGRGSSGGGVGVAVGRGVGVGNRVAVGSGVDVGTGVGTGVGTEVCIGIGIGVGVAVGVGVGRGVGVSAAGGIAVGNGSVVRLTSDAQADNTNNNTTTAKIALIDFIYPVSHPYIKISGPREKALAYRSITRRQSILHELRRPITGCESPIAIEWRGKIGRQAQQEGRVVISVSPVVRLYRQVPAQLPGQASSDE